MNIPSAFTGFAMVSLGIVVAAGQNTNLPMPGDTVLKSSSLSKKIVLIGGKKSHGPGEHDFPNGIPLMASWLKSSPSFTNVEVVAFPGGFPTNLNALDGASCVICYFDGVQETPAPLSNPARIAVLQKLMDAGAGLVCLHQASTLPKDDQAIPLGEWLGAYRNGMYDRIIAQVTLKPASPQHPVSSGVGEFTYTDEFYPTLIFSSRSNITPILRARLTPHLAGQGNQGMSGKTADYILAWAYERPGGGRSFGFTGGHFIKGFQEPELKKLLMNAIAWTARIDVPKNGMTIPDAIPSAPAH
ncbi:MAG TPA: ThuA domain-containing protein [Candidatus Polarisedimenticolia bacterium]|nr:ThuA domain-containing protein [Candidatus Polarisedimenticolia bacterium]